jgi:hypothetical protein
MSRRKRMKKTRVGSLPVLGYNIADRRQVIGAFIKGIWWDWSLDITLYFMGKS